LGQSSLVIGTLPPAPPDEDEVLDDAVPPPVPPLPATPEDDELLLEAPVVPSTTRTSPQPLQAATMSAISNPLGTPASTRAPPSAP
jgi:hypothetical protein